MKESELTRQKFGNALYSAFIAEGKSEEECNKFSDRYDALTATGMSGSVAFSIIYESYGSCNGRDLLNQASRYVHDSLSDFTKFAPKIKLNSKTRLADTIAKFNKNLEHLASISINGVSLDASEIEKLKIPALSNVTTESYSAIGSDQTSKVKGLSLDVIK